MITNATLVSASAPPVPDGRGGTTPAEVVSIGVRCCLDTPSMAQRATLAGRIAEADATLLVPWPTTGWPAFRPRQRVVVQLDSGSTRTLQIVEVIERIHQAGESHWQLFGRSE